MLSIAVASLITFASQTWLQAIHIVKHRNNIELLRGVSVTGLLVTIFSEVLWVSYSLPRELFGGTSNAVLSLVSAFIILAFLYRKHIPLRSDTTCLISTVLIVTTLAILLPTTYVALLVTLIGPIFLLPQTVKTVRSIGTPQVQGIGNIAIAMIICANTAWIVYGVIYQSWAYIVSSGVLLACGLTTAAAKSFHHRALSA